MESKWSPARGDLVPPIRPFRVLWRQWKRAQVIPPVGVCAAAGNPAGNVAPVIVAVREPLRGSLCGERAGPRLRGSITLSPRSERRAEEGGVCQEDRASPRGTMAFVFW